MYRWILVYSGHDWCHICLKQCTFQGDAGEKPPTDTQPALPEEKDSAPVEEAEKTADDNSKASVSPNDI